MKHTPPIEHDPTPAEIRKKMLALHDREVALGKEGHALYIAAQHGQHPPQPLDDRQRAVRAHVAQILNGSTPPELLKPAAPSRDDEIQIELAAIRIARPVLVKMFESAMEREAQLWVDAHADDWRTLCHDITIAATRLAALEEKARQMIAHVSGLSTTGLVMTRLIGAGNSMLGIGDPVGELRDAAIREGVCTRQELKEVRNV